MWSYSQVTKAYEKLLTFTVSYEKVNTLAKNFLKVTIISNEVIQ